MKLEVAGLQCAQLKVDVNIHNAYHKLQKIKMSNETDSFY